MYHDRLMIYLNNRLNLTAQTILNVNFTLDSSRNFFLTITFLKNH